MKKMLTIVVISLILLGIFGAGEAVFASTLGAGLQSLTQSNDLILWGKYGESVYFSDGLMRQFFGATTYPDITITSLPDPKDGTLFFGGVRPSVGQTVPRHAIGKLCFTPVGQMVEEATFTFTAGSACGGATITCRIRFTNLPNSAPKVTGATSYTLGDKGGSLLGTLAGYDPEGDSLEYLIISYPENGSLRMVDTATGDFRYTPRNGFSGKDRFTYVIRDAYGNYSTLSTIEILVDGERGTVDFSDMEESGYRTAAEAVVARGLMGYYEEEGGISFREGESVSREAWVVMVMKACGIYLPYSAEPTYFDDDASISAAAKPYLKLASEKGYFTGELVGNALLSNPKAPITRGEAAEVLYGVLSDVMSLEGSVPTVALGGDADAIAVLNLMGLFPKRNGSHAENGALTRGTAAEILWGVLQMGTN